MGSFTGFPPDGLAFFRELETNNERPWWLANKDRFEASVKGPMLAMLDELEPAYGTFHVFRMNRDVRFSKDKSLYKTAQGAVTETEGGATVYVQFSATGLFVGTGLYHPARDQLARFRDAVADDATGPTLQRAITRVRKSGLEVTGGREAPLATAPKGVPKDHPRIELLRWKGCTSQIDLGAPAWLHTRRAVAEVRKAWERSKPLTEWLDANVGASELPPER